MDPNLKVSCRDFVIFQLKLLINGMKDGMVFTVSFVADLVFKRHGQRRFFYRVLRLSERFDLWLNLHGAAERAETDPDGLFGVSVAGSDTLLGALEQITCGGDEPRGSVELSPSPSRSLEEDYARSREAK